MIAKPDFWRDPNVGALALLILCAFFVAVWWFFYILSG